MRKALIVGINYYENCGSLYGCVDDAQSVMSVLERHGDVETHDELESTGIGKTNFACRLIKATGPTDGVTRRVLKDHLSELFKTPSEIALFYFAGHGHIESTGGYLVTTDSTRGDEGLSLNEILTLANDSPSKNKIIVLDSCHSGIAGTSSTGDNLANLSEGLIVLTASTADQYATEQNGKGVFTSLFVDALGGGAANLTGDITPGAIYAHIDQALGPWEQRPVFKTNVKQFVSVRRVTPPIKLSDLLLITKLFPVRGFEFKLDPTFEPEMGGRVSGMPDPIPENTRKFSVLQNYNRLNLVVPINARHMWNAAMESKSCKLTSLGEHYRALVEKGRI